VTPHEARRAEEGRDGSPSSFLTDRTTTKKIRTPAEDEVDRKVNYFLSLASLVSFSFVGFFVFLFFV